MKMPNETKRSEDEDECTCEWLPKGGKPHPGFPDITQNIEREIVKYDPNCPAHGERHNG